MNRFLQYNGEGVGGRLRSWRRILVLAVVMCVSLSAMFFSAWQAEATNPTLGAIVDQTAVVGVAFTLTLPAATAPSNVNYALTGLPSFTGLTFDTSTRVLSGTPVAADVSESGHTLTYTATDADTPADSAAVTFTLVVKNDYEVTVTNATDGSTNAGFTLTKNIDVSNTITLTCSNFLYRNGHFGLEEGGANGSCSLSTPTGATNSRIRIDALNFTYTDPRADLSQSAQDSNQLDIYMVGPSGEVLHNEVGGDGFSEPIADGGTSFTTESRNSYLSMISNSVTVQTTDDDIFEPNEAAILGAWTFTPGLQITPGMIIYVFDDEPSGFGTVDDQIMLTGTARTITLPEAQVRPGETAAGSYRLTSVPNLPTGVSFTPGTRELTATTALADTDTYVLTYNAYASTDGSGTALYTASFNLEVRDEYEVIDLDTNDADADGAGFTLRRNASPTNSRTLTCTGLKYRDGHFGVEEGGTDALCSVSTTGSLASPLAMWMALVSSDYSTTTIDIGWDGTADSVDVYLVGSADPDSFSTDDDYTVKAADGSSTIISAVDIFKSSSIGQSLAASAFTGTNSNEFSIRATDDNTLETGTERFMLTAAPSIDFGMIIHVFDNDQAGFGTVDDQVMLTGTARTITLPEAQVSSSDTAAGSYRLTSSPSLPTGVSFTPGTRALTATTALADTGTYTLTYNAYASADGTGDVLYTASFDLVVMDEYEATVTNTSDGATDAGFTLTKNTVTGSGTVSCAGLTYRGTHPNGHFYLPEGESDATCTVSTTGTSSFDFYYALRKWTGNPIKSDEAEVISTSVDVDMLLTGSATATAETNDQLLTVYAFDGSEQISATTHNTLEAQFFENDDLLNGNTFGLHAVDDTEDEQDEAFLVSANVLLADPSFAMYVYIEDNDPPVFESAPTNLSYTVSSPIIDVILPKTKGDSGSGVTYTLTASGGGGTGGFPSGLSFDSTTRTLSGTTGSTGETATMTYTATENGVAVTATFTITISASLIAINGPDATYATGQTVSATASSVTDADETWEYQLIDGGADCTGTTTGTFTTYTAGTALTYGADASPAVTTDADDGKKVCFKLTDTKGTATDTTDDQIHYLASGILQLDNAAPTLSLIADDTPGGDSYIGITKTFGGNFYFTSDEAGTIIINVCSFSSSSNTIAVVGTNMISFLRFRLGAINNCSVTVTDAAGNTSTPLSFPEFFSIGGDPEFSPDTISDKVYQKGVQIAQEDLPADIGSGRYEPLTYTLTDLPTGTGLIFTPPATATGTGSLTGTPNQADADASPFTLTYTVTDSTPAAADGPRTDTILFQVTVTDFAIAVADDSYTASERTKEITATATGGTGTNLQWGLVSAATDCAAASTPTLSSSWTSGTAVVVDTEDANTKYACFKATYASSDYYSVSGQIGGIDRTNPVVSTVPLTGVLTDAYLNSEEVLIASANAIVGTPTVSETSTYTTAYAVVSGGTTCNASVTYTATAPDTTDVSGADGSYKVCVRATDAATNVGYGGSPTFTKDTVPPTVSTVPLAGALTDTYLSSAETSDAATIVGTVSHTGTAAGILYAVVSGSTTCEEEGIAYGSAPKANAVSGADGTYKICVRVADAAGNTGFGGSQTFTKDTSAPTLTRAIAFNGEQSHDNKVYLNQGDTITITVTANEDTRAGNKTVSLIIGSDTRSVTLTRGGANNRVYTGTYTVVSGETATYVGIETPNPANNILDLAGNSISLFAAGDALGDHITETAVIVDTTPPSAPTIDLREADDTYGDIDHDNAYDATTDFGTNNDNITSNTNPYYTFGAVENTNGVTLTLRYAGASCAEHTVSGGDYTPDVQCTAAQSDGERAVTATVTDRAGNVSPAAAALTVTIDTVDPPAMDIDLKSESDLGVSDTDNYTSSHDLTFTITGNTNSESLHAVLQKGATSQHNHDSAHADLSAPTGELTRNTGGTGNGENPVFKVLTHDLAGNTGLTATADAETVYLDYVTAVPSFTFNSAFDSGAQNNDGITNSRQLGFSIGNIEVEAANRGNGAEVTVYDNSGTGSAKGAAVSLADEIGHEHAPVTAIAHTTETQQTDFADGKHGFFVCQTDDAGNTSCTTSALNWIVDTVAPDAPGRPDLKAEDDSYGANANGARDGTDSDDLTNKQSDLTVASFASGQGTHDDGAHDHHQIRFYKWTDTNSDSAVDDGELAELKAPTNNVADASNIAETAGYGSPRQGAEKDLYGSGDVLTENTAANPFHYFLAKQYDIAGNLSPVSPSLQVKVDTTAPEPVAKIIMLHASTDSGADNEDHQTSNPNSLFIFKLSTVPGQVSDDLDYYEMWRVKEGTDCHSDMVLTATYAYPSNSDSAGQTSYEYTAQGTTEPILVDELADTYGEGAYRNGAAVKITQINNEALNTCYRFKANAVDLAGNNALGAQAIGVKILVPPPTPQAMDLAATDDTSRAGLTGGDADNSTSATVWTLSGLYKNNNASEWDLDSDGTDDTNGGAAGGVGSVEIRVQRLDTDGSTALEEEVVTITTVQAQGAIVSPTDDPAKGDYTFTTDVAVTSVFTGTNGNHDGDYRIDVRALNTGGEPGSYSNPLTVTLDTTPPARDGIGAADGHLKIETVRFNDSGSDRYPRHDFYLTDPSNGEPNAVVSIEHTDTDGSRARAQTIDIDSSVSFNTESMYTLSDDFTTYTVAYIDAAGNTTGKQPLPDTLKPPLITSYDIGSDTYIVVASARNDAGLQTPYKKFTADSNTECQPKKSSLVKTDYTPGSQIDLLSGDKTCIEVTDGNGHTSVIAARAESQPLIANFTLNEDGNEPDRSPTDFITNNTTLRLQGTTLPGSTARLLVKESAQSWGDPSDPNDNFEGTELAIPTERINADTGAFEVTYEIPVDYHGGTYTFETRGYVTNIETLGATEIGPITLRDTVYDAEAPAKPSQAPSLLTGSDDTGILGDGITAKTENINFQIRGEKEAIMTLSTGEMRTNPSSSENFETVSQILVSSLTEGTHTITVTATDKAGNTSPPSDPFTLTIDPTAPEITIVRLNDEDTTIDSDTRFITVANDETTVAFRVAAIAESDCETATWTTTGSAYTSPEQFNPNTAFSAVANGACFIARDAAHNIATKHSDDAIEGVGDARITGATKEGTTFYTKSGQRELTGVTASGAKVLIKITADEPTAFTDTQLRDTGFADHSFDMDAAATTFAEFITIPSGADGQKLIAWIWTDKSDQTTATPAITLGALTVDDTPATVTATAARTSNSSGTTAKQHDTLFLDITVNEIMQSATVTLAGITATEADCAVPSTADTLFTCSVTLSNEAHEGAARAEWTLADRAGNETTGTLTAEIIIDATAPAVTVTSSRGMLISANDALTLNLGVTDTNGITAGTYAFSATGGTLATCEVTATAGQKSAATSCALTVTATGDGAPVTLTVPRLTDTPGNEKPQHTRVIARVDTTAPTLSAITDQDSAKKKKFSFTLEAAHNQHTSSRDIPETLTPLFGGDCEDFKTNAKFTAQVPDATTQTYTATATASKGTYETCAITLRDEAGNESAALTFTEFTVKGGGGIGRIGGALFGKIQSFFSGGNRDTTSVFNPIPPSAQQQIVPQTPAPSVPRQETVTITLPARVTATYSLGDTHKHVRAAQILLNQTSCPVTSSGPGSPGRETTYFGSLTQRAITCFQRARRLPEDGTLTPRLYAALLSAARAGAAAPPARQTPTPEQRTPTSAPQLAPTPVQPIAETPGVTVPDRVAATYILGDTNEHIRAAQILLNKTSCPVASSGPGSPGRETAYFGSLTERAITCLQRTQGRPEDGILTPRLYTALHSAVYPAAARQQAPTVDNTPPTTPPADTDQQENRQPVETPAKTPAAEESGTVYQPITQPYTIKRRSFEAPSL